jgi:hypothetical protein
MPSRLPGHRAILRGNIWMLTYAVVGKEVPH